MLALRVPVFANPVILPAVREVVGKAATQPGRNPLAAKQAAQHQCEIAAGPYCAPCRRSMNGQRAGVALQNACKTIGNGQGIPRDASKIGLVDPVGAKPFRVDDDPLYDGIERVNV